MVDVHARSTVLHFFRANIIQPNKAEVTVVQESQDQRATHLLNSVDSELYRS